MRRNRDAAGFGDGHAVEQHQRRVAVASAREQAESDRRCVPSAPRLESGDVAQQVLDEWKLAGSKSFAVKTVAATPASSIATGAPVRGHHHAIARRRELQLDLSVVPDSVSATDFVANPGLLMVATQALGRFESAMRVGGGSFRAAGDFRAFDRAAGGIQDHAPHMDNNRNRRWS